jgi:hydroxymethylglutaryl-CoA synthase
MIDGLDMASADATFAAEVSASLLLPAQIGNVYTGSLYLALASLLHAEARAIEGQRVGLFSYGSGCVAEFFAGRVAHGASSLVEQLDLDAPVRASTRLSMAAYEAIRRGDADADRRAAPPAAPLHLGASELPVAFLGVDTADRRIYGVAEA